MGVADGDERVADDEDCPIAWRRPNNAAFDFIEGSGRNGAQLPEPQTDPTATQRRPRARGDAAGQRSYLESVAAAASRTGRFVEDTRGRETPRDR
jgi:hypothetical protein